MNEPFLGRNQELRTFEDTMSRFWKEPWGLPIVCLIYGQGGIGKTTLLNKFLDLVKDRYDGRFLRLHLNWQETRFGEPTDATHLYVDPEAVFNLLSLEAEKLPKWRKTAYHGRRSRLDKALDRVRDEVNRLEKTGDASAKEPAWIDLAAKTLGKGVGSTSVGLAAPVVEFLAKKGLQVLPNQLARLSKRLKEEDLRLIQEAELYLAEGLGEGLAEVASPYPVLVSFDTYELVQGADLLIRRIIERAGPSVFWIIAGRHNLYETREDTPRGRLDGYRVLDGRSYQVMRFDPGALARDDIRELFREVAPKRPKLTDEELSRVDHATRAVPLAVRIAADIWEKTGDLDRITDLDGEDDVVRAMVRRYEQHCPANSDDRRALRAMALANGDAELLAAMLRPEHSDLDTFLKQVRHRYAAVQHTSKGRLHDVPAAFFMEDMRDRADDEVRELVKRAIGLIETRIDRANAYALCLEDVCDDSDYAKAVIRKASLLFWLDETQAWAWITARAVEALPFAEARLYELAEEAEWHKPRLSSKGKKRLAVLNQARGSVFASAFRGLLHDDIEGRGFLAGHLVHDPFRDEVVAAWIWFQAESLRREERCDEALALLERVPSLMKPEKSPQFRRTVADIALAICYSFYLKKEYEKMRAATGIAVAVAPDNSWALRDHGTAHGLLKDYEKAIEFHTKAAEIDPRDAAAWRELGTDHSNLNDYGKAIEFHTNAVELDPWDAAAWCSLGIDYQYLGLYDKASHAWGKSLEYDQNAPLTLAWMGYWAMLQGHVEEAERWFAKALKADKGHGMSWSCKGALAYRMGQLNQAHENFQQAVISNPDQLGSLLDLIALQRLMGETEVASENLVRANTLASKWAHDSHIIAKLKALTEDPEAALELLAASTAVAPDDRNWALFLPAFHWLRDDPRFKDLTGDVPGSRWPEIEAGLA